MECLNFLTQFGHSWADIGANLTDEMFRGVYNGRQCHEDDFAQASNHTIGGGGLRAIWVERMKVWNADHDLLCGVWKRAGEFIEELDREQSGREKEKEKERWWALGEREGLLQLLKPSSSNHGRGASHSHPTFSFIYKVLERAREMGVEKIMVTAGRLQELQEALSLTQTNGMRGCSFMWYYKLGIS